MGEEKGHSLFHDQDAAVLGLKGIIELNEIHVIQLVHDVDLILHFILSGRKSASVWADLGLRDFLLQSSPWPR